MMRKALQTIDFNSNFVQKFPCSNPPLLPSCLRFRLPKVFLQHCSQAQSVGMGACVVICLGLLSCFLAALVCISWLSLCFPAVLVCATSALASAPGGLGLWRFGRLLLFITLLRFWLPAQAREPICCPASSGSSVHVMAVCIFPCRVGVQLWMPAMRNAVAKRDIDQSMFAFKFWPHSRKRVHRKFLHHFSLNVFYIEKSP